jgi:diadenosine tetraphosphate (Ap4A) HIT family hydrolase
MDINKCKFCNLDNNIFNTKLLENEHFFVMPSLGSLVPNYLLIVTKRHINAMSELNYDEFKSYIQLIKDLSDIFKHKFNRYPIIFEHGTTDTAENGASSITHAHTHIVDFNYKNENKLIEELRFYEFDILNLTKIKQNYIYYQNPKGKNFISFDFEKTSQLMRIKIAEDLNIKSYFNWREHAFINNTIETINNFKKQENI